MAIDAKNSLRLLQMTLIVFFYLPTVLVAIQKDVNSIEQIAFIQLSKNNLIII